MSRAYETFLDEAPAAKPPRTDRVHLAKLSRCVCSTWDIHGLWPEYTNGGYPATCDNEVFSQTQISDLITRMNSEWPRWVTGSAVAMSASCSLLSLQVPPDNKQPADW